jgi:hypothetical protein
MNKATEDGIGAFQSVTPAGIVGRNYHTRAMWALHWGWYDHVRNLRPTNRAPGDVWLFDLYNRRGPFVQAYMEAILETETYDDEYPLSHRFDTRDFSYEAECRIIEECCRFCSQVQDILDHLSPNRERQAAYNFWYTRRGHGIGFLDGDFPEELADGRTWGEALDAACKGLGDPNVYADVVDGSPGARTELYFI